MPTYDYECKDCGNIIEVFHGISENPKVVCTECGQTNTERQITGGTGFILKGSGFYTTDYKRKETGQNTESKPDTPAKAANE